MKTRNKTITLESKGREYEIDCEFEISFDNNDGADRDGNRGVYNEWVEDVLLLGIHNVNRPDVDLLDRLSIPIRQKVYDFALKNCN